MFYIFPSNRSKIIYVSNYYVLLQKNFSKRKLHGSVSISWITLWKYFFKRTHCIFCHVWQVVFNKSSQLGRRNFLLVACYFLLVARCSLVFASCLLLFARCSLLFTHCSTKNSGGIFLGKSKQKFLHINLYKKFYSWITWKLG